MPQNNPKKNDLIWENAHGEGEMSIVFGMKHKEAVGYTGLEPGAQVKFKDTTYASH